MKYLLSTSLLLLSLGTNTASANTLAHIRIGNRILGIFFEIKSVCSGFLAPGGDNDKASIATARHCIRSGRDYEVVLIDTVTGAKETHAATVQCLGTDSDFALLDLKMTLGDLKNRRFNPVPRYTQRTNMGDHLEYHAIDDKLELRKGTCTAYKRGDEYFSHFTSKNQITTLSCTASHGYSGAAVFNSLGEIAALLSAGDNYGTIYLQDLTYGEVDCK